MSIEAMKQALEALELERPYLGPMPTKTSKAITSLRQAIKEHALREVQRLGQEIEQEPVGVMVSMDVSKGDEPEYRIFGRIYEVMKDGEGEDEVTYLAIEESRNFDTPPQRKPLTDTEVSLVAHNEDPGDWNSLDFRECWHEGFVVGFRAAEECHKIGV